MNYPEQPTRPLKRLPMAHIVTVTGKLSVKGGYFSFFQNLGPPLRLCIVFSRVPQLEKWFWIVYCCSSLVAVQGKQTLGPIWVSRLNFQWNSQRQQQVGSSWRMSPELNCPIVLNMITNTSTQNTSIAYEAVSDQGPVWVQREAIFQGSCKAFLNGQICSNYYNMMYWERILQKNHLITCFRRFYQRPYHLAA